MNIIDALKELELCEGYIERDHVEIHRWYGETWQDFLKCRATLNIEDLLAEDWSEPRSNNI